MFPTIKLLHNEITYYVIMVIIGIIATGYYLIRMAKKHKIDDNDLIRMGLVGFIGAFIGGHILYGITNIKLLFAFIRNFDQVDSIVLFFKCLLVIFGGSVFYGGLIGCIVAIVIYLKRKKADSKTILNISAPAIPLFHFFGRLGCFLSGCCYGIESKLGFTYHYSAIESANNVQRFPIQLVEATFNLLLFALLHKIVNKYKNKYPVLIIYLLIYSVGRFIFEFFRGDEYRGIFLGLSTSQIISILIFISSIIYIILRNKKRTISKI